MLDSIALGILCFSVIVVFYGIIVIHDIPYEIAKHRNHPHLDAIHVAGWVSLLTLHILWPFIWIWSTLYREDRGWGFSNEKTEDNPLSIVENQLIELSARIETLELSSANALIKIEELAKITTEATKNTPVKVINEPAPEPEPESKSESVLEPKLNDKPMESN